MPRTRAGEGTTGVGLAQYQNTVPIVAAIFGWPAVIASVALALVGVATTRAKMVLAGAIVGCPFLFYLFLTPRFRWVAPPAAALLFVAVRAAVRRQRGKAFLFVAPYVGLVAFVAYLAANQ
jgi:hypothetical protein